MIIDARNATYDASHSILFDANVWLSLYAPPSGGNNCWAYSYSTILNKIIDNKVPVLLNATVLSEYINRYCRIEFQAYEEYVHPNSRRSFKEFRTQDISTYKSIAADAASRVQEILEIPDIICISDDFAEMGVIEMVEDFAQGDCDWNDQQIIYLCKRNACSLLTNDADFKDADIQILTCNNRLLNTK